MTELERQSYMRHHHEMDAPVTRWANSIVMQYYQRNPMPRPGDPIPSVHRLSMPECPLHITVLGADQKPILKNLLQSDLQSLSQTNMTVNNLVPIQPKPIHRSNIGAISGAHCPEMFTQPFSVGQVRYIPAPTLDSNHPVSYVQMMNTQYDTTVMPGNSLHPQQVDSQNIAQPAPQYMGQSSQSFNNVHCAVPQQQNQVGAQQQNFQPVIQNLDHQTGQLQQGSQSVNQNNFPSQVNNIHHQQQQSQGNFFHPSYQMTQQQFPFNNDIMLQGHVVQQSSMPSQNSSLSYNNFVDYPAGQMAFSSSQSQHNMVNWSTDSSVPNQIHCSGNTYQHKLLPGQHILQQGAVSSTQSYAPLNNENESAFIPVTAHGKKSKQQAKKKQTEKGNTGKGKKAKSPNVSSILEKANETIQNCNEEPTSSVKPEELLTEVADREVAAIHSDSENIKREKSSNSSDEALEEASERLERTLSAPSPLVSDDHDDDGSTGQEKEDSDKREQQAHESEEADDRLPVKKFQGQDDIIKKDVLLRSAGEAIPPVTNIKCPSPPYTVVKEDTSIKVPITKSRAKSTITAEKKQAESPGISAKFTQMSLSSLPLHERRGEPRPLVVSTKYANEMTGAYEAAEMMEYAQNGGDRRIWPVNYSQKFKFPSKKHFTENTHLLATNLALKEIEKQLKTNNFSTDSETSESSDDDGSEREEEEQKDITSQANAKTESCDLFADGMGTLGLDSNYLSLFPDLTPQEEIISNPRFWPDIDHSYSKIPMWINGLGLLTRRVRTGKIDLAKKQMEKKCGDKVKSKDTTKKVILDLDTNSTETMDRKFDSGVSFQSGNSQDITDVYDFSVDMHEISNLKMNHIVSVYLRRKQQKQNYHDKLDLDDIILTTCYRIHCNPKAWSNMMSRSRSGGSTSMNSEALLILEKKEALIMSFLRYIFEGLQMWHTMPTGQVAEMAREYALSLARNLPRDYVHINLTDRSLELLDPKKSKEPDTVEREKVSTGSFQLVRKRASKITLHDGTLPDIPGPKDNMTKKKCKVSKQVTQGTLSWVGTTPKKRGWDEDGARAWMTIFKAERKEDKGKNRWQRFAEELLKLQVVKDPRQCAYMKKAITLRFVKLTKTTGQGGEMSKLDREIMFNMSTEKEICGGLTGSSTAGIEQRDPAKNGMMQKMGDRKEEDMEQEPSAVQPVKRKRGRPTKAESLAKKRKQEELESQKREVKGYESDLSSDGDGNNSQATMSSLTMPQFLQRTDKRDERNAFNFSSMTKNVNQLTQILVQQTKSEKRKDESKSRMYKCNEENYSDEFEK